MKATSATRKDWNRKYQKGDILKIAASKRIGRVSASNCMAGKNVQERIYRAVESYYATKK